MSRIQEILKKAEREGGVHRTRALTVDRRRPARCWSSRGPWRGRRDADAAPVATRGVAAPAVSRVEPPPVTIPSAGLASPHVRRPGFAK